MEGITERELISIREAQADFMPQTLQVYRSYEIDGEKSSERTGEPIQGRITPNLGSLWRTVADQYAGLTMYSITGPYDWDVRDGDEVYDAYGRAYKVRDVRNPSSYHTAKQVLAEGWDNDG